MKNISFCAIFVVLSSISLTVDAVCRSKYDAKSKSSSAKPTLHHITEFRKRDEIKMEDCDEHGPADKKSSSDKPLTGLGLHGLLHVRSQKKKQQTGTRRDSSSSLTDAIVLKKKPEQENGKRRTANSEAKLMHKIKLRAETIRMLHQIVEKYFPGGHLTVDQKIKALKILGKIIKLKKEGKTSDIKSILQSVSGKGQSSLENKTSKLLKKMKDSDKKTEKDGDSGGDGGDLYATIANGPDVPKLPPPMQGNDMEHAHSNVMPVGFHHGDSAGPENFLGEQNDMSDDFNSYHSQYSNYNDLGRSFGQGQIYNTGNSYYTGGMMTDDQAYARSRTPFPSFRRRFYDDGYDDDESDEDEDDDDDSEDDDDDDDDDDEEEDEEDSRSYVNRHDYENEDEEQDDQYSGGFDRKDKIAKHSKKHKSNTTKHKNLSKV